VHWRQFFLRYRATIVVGEGHKGTVLIANTENVAVLQCLAERFVTPDLASVIEQTIQRFLALRVRVNKDKLVALAYNLDVVARDGTIADYDIGSGITTDIDDWLVESERFSVA
jgi:hypothetical protein